MDLSIGKLQQLVTVARTGSFSRAAVELNISQPALSRSIAGIEDRYGFQIFSRMGHGVALTAAGSQVVAQAGPLLQSLRVFDSNLRLFGSGKAGRLQFGLAPLLASQILARFAGELFTSDTAARLSVMIRPGPDLLDALRNDEIELFFYPESHIEPITEIEVEPVGAIVASCVVRRDHPLAGREGLTLRDLAIYPWASSVDPPIVDEHFSSAQLTCDNYHILRDAVLESDLVCICSNAFVAPQLADGSLREIRVEGLPLPPTTIYMAKLRGRAHSPLAQEAVRRISKYLQ
ncbi:LysR family transcriptional regulator [Sphingobium sufflavum]|uniref:LysR family transcriptional regulator n=1 Tax=Sphingobium sufflavum TaxID=1129547 RepID=UPI001F1FAC42|nr:LysR family transcriptional regulator [Sphingobium sufflavum]MCE7796636.1 LysR family transcriptional regulator [Sphingobium sufflavum]